jgi:CDGSH-type Zn-finger protein
MIVVTILALAVLGFVGKLIYDVQQNKKKPTQNEDGFDKDALQKLAGIKPTNPNDEIRQILVKNNIFGKQQIIDALLKAAENSEFPKPDESINVRTTKIGTIDTNFGDSDPLATIPMSRISNEGKKKMAEIAKEDIKLTTKAKAAKLASIFPDVIEYTDEYSKPDYSNVAKCGCGRSETGFCTGLHKIPKKAWAEGVRDIPAEKPKRKYTKNKTK